MKDEVKTRLIFENGEDRFVWESPYSDVTMEDILNALYGMLVGKTWTPATVIKAMKDFADENDIYVNDERDFDVETKPHFYA